MNRAFSKILILVIVVLAAGGILSWQYFGTPKEGVGILKEELIEDETADWQTYKNEEYGFEIKYPREWREEETSSGILFLSSNDILSREKFDPHFHTFSAFISIKPAEFNNSLRKAVANSYDTNELVIDPQYLSEIEERTFVENTFLFVLERVQAFGECHNFIKKGDVLIDIERDGKLGCNDDQFNQMLSTFRFLGQ